MTLYYSHHFREREWAEARKKKFETEMEEVPNMDVENVRTPQEVEAFRGTTKRGTSNLL